MNSVIYKYPIKLGESNEMQLPQGAEVLTVGIQSEEIFIWAKIDPEAKTEKRRFRVVGTGHHLFPEKLNLKYIGTVILDEVRLVWHIFEDTP